MTTRNGTSPARRREAFYLDHAATTPLRPAARDALVEATTELGNPASLHGSGRTARRRLEEARELVAERLGCGPAEVVFTSGGTEADNLAIVGQAMATEPTRPIAVGTTEHHSVLDAAAGAVDRGYASRVDLVGVDGLGHVDQGAVTRLADREPDQRPSVLAVMLANNEVGTVGDVAAVAGALDGSGVAVHTDAVQAVGHIDVDFDALGVSSMSLAAHKFGGPMGIGALVLARGADCRPITFGGGQERDLRSGTVNVPGAWALAVALDEACRDLAADTARIAALRDRLVAGVLERVPDAQLNGAPLDAPGARLPGNANLTFPGCSGESLILLLDAAGIECSTGAACTAGVAEPSHVVLALGGTNEDARSSLRFSLGWNSTDADVDAVLAAIGPAAERARGAGLGVSA